MFGTDIEKSLRACNSFSEPTQAHIDRRNTFLPSYEETLNHNLRNFGEPESQINLNAFDSVQEPKRGRRECMKREYLIIGTIFLCLCAVALPLGLVYILRDAGSKQGTATMQTRRAETSFSYAPVTISNLPTAIIPMTVYVTLTPTPQVVIPIVTITVTAPSSEVDSVTIQPQATNTETNLSILTTTASAPASPSTTIPEVSTAPFTSDISTSTTDTTIEASTQSQLSGTGESDSPTDTTTVVSATTIEPTRTSSKVMQTSKGRFGFCGVSGSNCARGLSKDVMVDGVEALVTINDE